MILTTVKEKRAKMADSEKSQLESALNTLLNITEKSGNLRKTLSRI